MIERIDYIMKITRAQSEVASLYWTQVLTREIQPKALVNLRKRLPFFMVHSEQLNRASCLQQLNQTNPGWPMRFMNSLNELLMRAENTICVTLQPFLDGLLKEAAKLADIPEALFPTGRLSMTFDDNDNIMVDEDIIPAKDAIHHALTV